MKYFCEKPDNTLSDTRRSMAYKVATLVTDRTKILSSLYNTLQNEIARLNRTMENLDAGIESRIQKLKSTVYQITCQVQMTPALIYTPYERNYNGQINRYDKTQIGLVSYMAGEVKKDKKAKSSTMSLRKHRRTGHKPNSDHFTGKKSGKRVRRKGKRNSSRKSRLLKMGTHEDKYKNAK